MQAVDSTAPPIARTILNVTLGVTVGIAAFTLNALLENFARGLQEGAIVGVDGVVVGLLAGWWSWATGAAVFLVAVVVFRVATARRTPAVGLYGAGTLGLLIAIGIAMALAFEPDEFGRRLSNGVDLMVLGAESSASWVLLAGFLVIGALTRSATPTRLSPEFAVQESLVDR